MILDKFYLVCGRLDILFTTTYEDLLWREAEHWMKPLVIEDEK